MYNAPGLHTAFTTPHRARRPLPTSLSPAMCSPLTVAFECCVVHALDTARVQHTVLAGGQGHVLGCKAEDRGGRGKGGLGWRSGGERVAG